MASKTGAYVLVVGGAVVAYSAFTKRSVIDTILMRPSPGNVSSGSANVGTDPNAMNPNSPAGSQGSLDPNQLVGGLRQAILEAALQAIHEPYGTYYYIEARPYPSSLFGPPIPVRIDCSSFVTLAYKAAGAPDPNRLGYSGMGYTGTLLANGTAVTNQPAQPGDLAFWSTPDHVAIYAGNDSVYEFGGPTNGGSQGPGQPIVTGVNEESSYHKQFLGFRSYLK